MAVMGHIGLTPQSAVSLGGFRVQGKTTAQARQLLDDARAVEDAGAFAVVLECVPGELGRAITAAVSVPTIGIGAGPGCDGQILVVHDYMGLFPWFRPKFVRPDPEADLGPALREAAKRYVHRTGAPDLSDSFGA